MPIAHFIAHQIERTQGSEPCKVIYRDNDINLDDTATELLNEIKHVFSTKTAKRYGQFNAELGENPVPAWLKDFRKEQMPFTSFSKKMAEHFSVMLNQTEEPFHGHLLFWLEDAADSEWLYVAQVQHQVGLLINSQLEISKTEYADLSHVGFSCRINLTHWEQQLSEKYLTVSKNRGDRALLQLLLDWIGFTDTVNATADTNEFLNIVEAYAENLPQEDSSQYKEKVIEYCMDQDKMGEPVVYKELSYYLDEHQPEQFEKFVQQQQEQPKQELIPDKAQLRKYVRFSGRSKEMSIQFAASMLGDGVHFDAEKEQLVFKQLPKSLLSQLKKHRSN
ncbi:MAG: nucleoid-associated protein [Pseudomonadales bacterium]|nr:nucleoid-associated protein [Pseudomonadales bacterium]